MRNMVRVSDESLPPVACLLNQFEIKNKNFTVCEIVVMEL